MNTVRVFGLWWFSSDLFCESVNIWRQRARAPCFRKMHTLHTCFRGCLCILYSFCVIMKRRVQKNGYLKHFKPFCFIYRSFAGCLCILCSFCVIMKRRVQKNGYLKHFKHFLFHLQEFCRMYTSRPYSRLIQLKHI